MSRLARIILLTGCAGVVAFLALRASPQLESIVWMPRAIGVWADQHGVLRNTAGFFLLSSVVLGWTGARPWHVAAIVGFGSVLEVAQLWIPTRVFDWRDLVAILAGVLLAWPFVVFGRRVGRSRAGDISGMSGARKLTSDTVG